MNKKTMKAKLIKELSEKITYWTGKNDEYAAAYIMMLHSFTIPKEDSADEEDD